MRISDWSSDVCSSDLRGALDELGPLDGQAQHVGQILRHPVVRGHAAVDAQVCPVDPVGREGGFQIVRLIGLRLERGARDMRLCADRKSVVWGKSVSVRVDIGGRRTSKKKTNRV